MNTPDTIRRPSRRIVKVPQATAVARTMEPSQRPHDDAFPRLTADPDLSLIYTLLGGTALLLLSALAWSLVN